MITKSPKHSEYELHLQVVEAASATRAPISAAIFLGAQCEFSLSDAGKSRSALNEVGSRSQGTADSLSHLGFAIKLPFQSQIIVHQHNPNKRERS